MLGTPGHLWTEVRFQILQAAKTHREELQRFSRFPHSMEMVSSGREGSVCSFTTCPCGGLITWTPLSMTYQVWGAASSTAGCYGNPSPALWNPQFLTRHRKPFVRVYFQPSSSGTHPSVASSAVTSTASLAITRMDYTVSFL